MSFILSLLFGGSSLYIWAGIAIAVLFVLGVLVKAWNGPKVAEAEAKKIEARAKQREAAAKEHTERARIRAEKAEKRRNRFFGRRRQQQPEPIVTQPSQGGESNG